MAKEIWSSNESVSKQRPVVASKPTHRSDRWDADGNADNTKKWLIWGGVALVLILFFVFLVRPAWLGYQTYKAMKESGVPGEYALKMSEFQTRMETAEATAAQAVEAQAAAQSARSAAEQDRDKAKTDYEQYIASFQADSASKAAALDSCEEALNMQEPALKDAARRICCVQRVDNPSINAYEIDSGKIVCVSDGGESINC